MFYKNKKKRLVDINKTNIRNYTFFKYIKLFKLWPFKFLLDFEMSKFELSCTPSPQFTRLLKEGDISPLGNSVVTKKRF